VRLLHACGMYRLRRSTSRQLIYHEGRESIETHLVDLPAMICVELLHSNHAYFAVRATCARKGTVLVRQDSTAYMLIE
jgi:hypothetical protein